CARSSLRIYDNVYRYW
nr:immunoglobulin heavy chain junction region [Macaca mulatta]